MLLFFICSLQAWSGDIAIRKKEGDNLPLGWFGIPKETVTLDRDGGSENPPSVLIERSEGSSGKFSVLTRSAEVPVKARVIELRAVIRTSEVAGGAGLWVRQDGENGILHLDNMQDRPLTGTTEWSQIVLRQIVHAEAKQIHFGALLVGTGSIWVSKIELLVDGVLQENWLGNFPTEAFAVSSSSVPDTMFIDVTLNAAQIESLVLAIEIWGFLRYFHPRIQEGRVDWDAEFIGIFHEITKTGSREEAQKILLERIDRIGPLEPCQRCAHLPQDLHISPPTDWIDDKAMLGVALSERLRRLFDNRPEVKSQRYVSLVPPVGNVHLKYLAERRGLDFPSVGERALAGAILWNAVRYWFPYGDVMPMDWREVLRSALPSLVQANDAAAYRRAIQRMLSSTGDGHANLQGVDVRPPYGRCRWRAAFRFVEGKAIVVNAAERSTFELGDVLLAVDGKPVGTLIAEWRPYYSYSTEPALRYQIAQNLPRGICGSSVALLERDGRSFEVQAERVNSSTIGEVAASHDRPGPSLQFLSDRVAYLKLSNIELASVFKQLDRLQEMDALIIDVRGYPEEFVVFELGQHLVSESVAFARFTKPQVSSPGAFAFTPAVNLLPKTPRIEAKIAVLVDESTISQAEYTAMAFQKAPGALVVGSVTAGVDGNVSIVELPGNIVARMSGIGVFYPDKRPTQRVGIAPDIHVVPTIDGIRAGRDEVLEVAFRRLVGEQVSQESVRRMTDL